MSAAAQVLLTLVPISTQATGAVPAAQGLMTGFAGDGMLFSLGGLPSLPTLRISTLRKASTAFGSGSFCPAARLAEAAMIAMSGSCMMIVCWVLMMLLRMLEI